MENAQFRKVMEAFGSMAMGIWAGTAGFTAMLARLCQTGKEQLLSQSLTKWFLTTLKFTQKNGYIDRRVLGGTKLFTQNSESQKENILWFQQLVLTHKVKSAIGVIQM